MAKGVVIIILVVGLVSLVKNGHCANPKSDPNDPFGLNQLNYREKALWTTDILMTHPVLFDRLLNIVSAMAPYISSSTQSESGNAIMPFILDGIPVLLKTEEFQAIMGILADEISRVDVSEVEQMKAAYNLPSNDSRVVNALVKSYVFKLNYPRLLQRIFMRHSAQDLFPWNNQTVSPQCYSHSMDFLDALVGGINPPAPNLTGPNFDFRLFPWAYKMFDSIGKPEFGIVKGNLFYVGSYDECLDVHAMIPDNIVLGNRSRYQPVEFDTRFCRVQIKMPKNFSDGFGVDTRGLQLSFYWGVCVPDSCHSSDVDGLLHLGPLQMLNLSLDVVCFEDNDLGKDPRAIIAIVILSFFGLLVLVTTLIDGLTDFYRTHFASKSRSGFGRGHVNIAYVANEHPHAKSERGITETKFNGTLDSVADASSPSGKYIPSDPNGKVALPQGEEITTAAPAEPAEAAKVYNEIQDPPYQNEALDKPINAYESIQEPAERKPKPKDYRLVKAFSLYNTLPKIYHAKKNPGSINCIHGIRLFSVLYVMLGHTFNYGLLNSATENPTTLNVIDADAYMKRFTFQAIMAGGFAVDTFFVISGLLVTYLFLKDMKKKKLTPGYMIVFYVHRYWRLTPVYMIVLMTFSCLYKYLGDGPMWPRVIENAEYCHDTWWTNLLYINNLVDVNRMCLGWSWYMSNDMQFYVVSPFFIILLAFLPIAGILVTILMIIAGIIAAFVTEYKYGGDIFTFNPGYFEQVYVKPWCRMAAYGVGILIGYIMFKMKREQLKAPVVMIGWFLTFAVGLTLCYVTYDYRKEGAEPWPIEAQAFYEAFGRPLWAACIAWIILACHFGKGGIINSFLSWNGIIPLARLSYAAYLIHPTIMMIHMFGKRAQVYIDDFDIAYLYMGHVVLTFLVATLFSAVFEAPMLALEKMVLKRH